MEGLFAAFVTAWCWLLVAASPTLLGALLGWFAWQLVGDPFGLVVGVLPLAAGFLLGVRFANHVTRKGQLVEYAHGLPESRTDDDGAAGAGERTSPDEGEGV